MSVPSPGGDAASRMDRMYRRQRHVYDASRKFYLLGRDEAIGALAPRPGDRVLEIACGTGRNLVRIARLYPHARLFGLDVSAEMLSSATAAVARAGLGPRIWLEQADATSFDPLALFGEPAFERIVISYALSMIPPWRETLAHAATILAPGGSLHVVDFGDQSGWVAPLRAGLRGWLAAFDVTPRDTLPGELLSLAERSGFGVACDSRLRGYAVSATLTRSA